MNVAVKLPPMMTVADFLDWPGDGTNTRYELVDGVLRAMAAASDTHNTIYSTFLRLIGNHLEKHHPNCRVVGTPGIQPNVRAKWNFRQPELVITCTPNRPSVHMTPHPIVVVEVLSPSNAADTYENVRAYTTIPSVKEIFVVHSTELKVERLARGPDGNWPPDAEMIEAGGALRIASFDCEWPIESLYATTHLV